jgi:hypothetical protein
MREVLGIDGLRRARKKPNFEASRSMVVLTWMRSASRKWHRLDTVPLADIDCVGVYLVWYAGTPGRVVCLGQGTIAAQLKLLRADNDVQQFKSRGHLLVTWAKVSAMRVDGVMRYMADTWPPLLARPLPQHTKPLEVNSPGWLSAFV